MLVRDADFSKRQLDEIVERADFRKIKVADALSRLGRKIERWEKLQNRIVLYGSAAFFLLFASIIGVSFEISVLGISLKSIEKLKEIIFVAFAVSGFFAGALSRGIKTLKELRRRIYAKKYGGDVDDLWGYLVEDEIPKTNFDMYLSNKEYLALRPKFVVELVRGVTMVLTILMAIGLYMFVSLTIAGNIWNNSNWGDFGGKVLVIFVLALSATELVTDALKTAFPFRYIDREKSAALAITDPNSGELVREVKDLIVRDVRFWQRFRAGVRLLVLVMAFLAFVAWKTWMAPSQ